MSRRARLAWVGLALVALLAGGLAISRRVFRPPVLMQAEFVDVEKVRTHLPDGSQRIELEVAAGTTLRGWYVPADEGAPLVLHLLESTASADSRFSSRALAAGQLADLGFASLFVDYAGVGNSGGAPSAENLGRDARALWDEALRRVGGDPERVVLRCTSIGTLAVLPLLSGGARPAGVILLLPVLPDTLAGRFATFFYGRPAGWIARAALRRVVDEDLFEVVDATHTAWLAVQADQDQLTSAAERAAIDAAIDAAGGRTERLAEDHFVGSIVLRALCEAEVRFLTEVVPGVRDIESRWSRFVEALPEDLRDTTLADEDLLGRLRSASAWSHEGDARTVLAAVRSLDEALGVTRLRWWLSQPRYRKLELDELTCVGDLDDPAGRIPFEVLLDAAQLEDLSTRTFSFRGLLEPYEIERHARDAVPGEGDAVLRVWPTRVGEKSAVELHPGELLGRLTMHGRNELDARRQLARMLLKVYAVPDRCVRAPDGATRLEYFSDGTWRAIETDPARPAAIADGGPVGGVQFSLGLPTSD
ncbi:MAG TPA: hypothetical protein VMT18_10345 [Planctomycetota bacterium]|nr:hypothetical protein [Planctomycetota bacterium]